MADGIPGGTIGTPIGAGSTTAPEYVSALEATWLSLDRWLRIVAGSVPPPHFFGGHDDDKFPVIGNCNVVVPRYGWQLRTVVSREEIKLAIKDAEDEISEYLGYKLAPTYIEKQMKMYPKPYDPAYVSSGRLNSSLYMEKSIQTDDRFMIIGGVRETELVGTAATSTGTLQYSDKDADGFAETAIITLPTSYTTQAELCEIRAFVPSTDGDDEWEIRHPRRKYFSGGNVIFEFDVWLMIDPQIDGRYPGDDYRSISISDTDNLLGAVDIYRIYTDNTQASVRFFWESGTDCIDTSESGVGSQVYQDGVVIVRDSRMGLLVPRAATYNSETGLWDAATWSVGRDPDQVRLSYYAGDVSRAFLNGRSCDPLKEPYARAIAYLATARLPRSICACDGVVAFFESLQRDMAERIDSLSYSISFDDLENPFGTRKGEIMAWNIVGKIRREKAIEGAVI